MKKRLINVIQAIDNLDAMVQKGDTSERAMGILEAINELGRMNCEEAIEAIPVEWLCNYALSTNNAAIFWPMFTKWYKEKENE